MSEQSNHIPLTSSFVIHKESTWGKIKHSLYNIPNYISTTFYYFRKERFFNYLLVIVFLVLWFGDLWLWIILPWLAL